MRGTVALSAAPDAWIAQLYYLTFSTENMFVFRRIQNTGPSGDTDPETFLLPFVDPQLFPSGGDRMKVLP